MTAREKKKVRMLWGKRLEEIRIAHNMSVKEVAVFLGVTYHAYRALENGIYEIGILKITKLARLYNLPISEFVPQDLLHADEESTRLNTYHSKNVPRKK